MGDKTWSTVVVTYWLPEDALQQGAGEQAQAQQDSQQQSQQHQQGQGQGQQQARNQPQGDGAQGTTYLPQQKERMFSQLDKNGDGVIDQQEASANDRLSQKFSKLDTYGNSQLTRSEFAALSGGRGKTAPSKVAKVVISKAVLSKVAPSKGVLSSEHG